jgi:Zn-dependent protease
MTDSFYWSASAGRWVGVPVRIHILLFLFVALIFGIGSNYASSGHVFGTALVTTIVLICSLVLHELAHVFALTNLGGHVNNIVLTPWGGNSDFELPVTSRERLIVFLAGPFANGIVAALGATLLLQANETTIFELFNSFEPFAFSVGAHWEFSLVKIITWVNIQLLLVNMIPCFPFDTVNVLRELVNWINPLAPRVKTETSIMVMGHAVAFTMIGFAWLFRHVSGGPIRPIWLVLLGSGITLLFSARYAFYSATAHADEDWDNLDDLSYESLYGEASFFEFPEDQSSGYSQWLSEKQEARKREEARIELDEDRRADDILKRLHLNGIDSISDEDRQVLNRVSARLRRKNQQVTDSYDG